jgi:hypothetical protein
MNANDTVKPAQKDQNDSIFSTSADSLISLRVRSIARMAQELKSGSNCPPPG